MNFLSNQILDFKAEFKVREKPSDPPSFSLVIPWHKKRVGVVYISHRGWCIPSGHILENENPEDTAYRELWEEATLKAESLSFLGHYVLTGRASTQTAMLYAANVVEAPEFISSDESLGRLFLPLNELKQYYFQWNPLLAKVFEYAKQERIALQGPER